MENVILLGDCTELTKQIPDESIDFVLTDPPYAREHIDCFRYLAQDVPRIMKEHSSLITITGHILLHDIMDLFEMVWLYRVSNG